VYADWNWKSNPRAYHGSVQLSLGTIERILQLHHPKEAGFYTGYVTPKGLTVMMAAETYARYILGHIPGGAGDDRASHHHTQQALEFAYQFSTDPAQKKLFEDALYVQLHPSTLPRAHFSRSYALSTCFIGEEIRE
jgi:hypothetical protein